MARRDGRTGAGGQAAEHKLVHKQDCQTISLSLPSLMVATGALHG